MEVVAFLCLVLMACGIWICWLLGENDRLHRDLADAQCDVISARYEGMTEVFRETESIQAESAQFVEAANRVGSEARRRNQEIIDRVNAPYKMERRREHLAD